MGDQYSHLLNQVHRRQLRAAGLAFCDDEFQEKSPAYDELLEQLDHLMGGAVSASSTDDPSQGPENLLKADQSFWSSRGADSPLHEEHVVFRLKPLSTVCAIRIAAYRAGLTGNVPHPGSPVYPPRAVSFSTGHQLEELHAVSQVFPCDPSNEWQTFDLPEPLPAGSFFKVTIHGSLQKQWSDHKYYTALREVEVLGYLPSPSEVRQFVRHQKACCSSPYSREAVEQVQPPQPQGLSEAASMLTAEQRAHESMCLFSAIEQLPLVDQPPDSGIAV